MPSWPVPAHREATGDRSVVGVLPDGTVFFAPRGRVLRGPDGMCCHLCGFWVPDLLDHLDRGHDWSARRYAAAFALRYHDLTSAPGTPRPLLRAHGTACPRDGLGPRRGGRSQPEQLRRTARQMAVRFGGGSLRDYVVPAVAAGLSLAELSRRAGLTAGWLERHLPDVDPAVAAEVAAVQERARRDSRAVGVRWVLRLAELGYADPLDYLRERRADGWSWERIAAEGRVSAVWLRRRRSVVGAGVDGPSRARLP